MGYRSLSCGRPAAEQRYILAMLRVFAQLPPERREAVRAERRLAVETKFGTREFTLEEVRHLWLVEDGKRGDFLEFLKEVTL